MKEYFIGEKKLSNLLTIALVFGLALLVSDALAGEWRVSPTRIDLSRNSKSSIVTVENVSEEIITLTTQVMGWTQDDDGKDKFLESDDLVVFPKVLLIKPGQSRVIRTGVKVPAIKQEKSYRLFIKEQPSEAEAKNGTISVVMQFAIPIFSKPLQEEFAGTFEKIDFNNSSLDILLRNTGNIFFRINDVKFSGKDVTGEETFQQELKGWYLLAGSARNFSIDLPSDVCATIQNLDVVVNTDHGPLTKQIELNQGMCSSSQ